LAWCWKARWSTLLASVLLVSLDNRNPLILNAVDSYFRMLLFWSLFLPLGARFSVNRCGRNTFLSSVNQGKHQVIAGGSSSCPAGWTVVLLQDSVKNFSGVVAGD
jgi:hypothetical protein